MAKKREKGSVAITLKLGDVWDGRVALQKLRGNEAFSTTDAYRLGLVLADLRKHIEVFGETNNALVERLGENGAVMPQSKNFNEFQSEMKALRETDVHIHMKPIAIDGGEKSGIPPMVFEFFGPMFYLKNGEEEEKE